MRAATCPRQQHRAGVQPPKLYCPSISSSSYSSSAKPWKLLPDESLLHLPTCPVVDARSCPARARFAAACSCRRSAWRSKSEGLRVSTPWLKTVCALLLAELVVTALRSRSEPEVCLVLRRDCELDDSAREREGEAGATSLLADRRDLSEVRAYMLGLHRCSTRSDCRARQRCSWCTRLRPETRHHALGLARRCNPSMDRGRLRSASIACLAHQTLALRGYARAMPSGRGCSCP